MMEHRNPLLVDYVALELERKVSEIMLYGKL